MKENDLNVSSSANGAHNYGKLRDVFTSIHVCLFSRLFTVTRCFHAHLRLFSRLFPVTSTTTSGDEVGRDEHPGDVPPGG